MRLAMAGNGGRRRSAHGVWGRAGETVIKAIPVNISVEMEYRFRAYGELFARSGSRGTRADRGVRPTISGLPPGGGGQPVQRGLAADGGARGGAGRGQEAHGIGGTVEEALDIGGKLSVLRLLRFALRRGATQARGEFVEFEGGDGAHLSIGRAGGQPDDTIHENALGGAADLGFVGGRGRGVESGLEQTVDDFLQAGQGGIDGVLRDHAGGAVELQGEADGDIGRNGGGTKRIEGVAGGAGEEFDPLSPAT